MIFLLSLTGRGICRVITSFSRTKPQENILKPSKHHTIDVGDNSPRGLSMSPSNTSQRDMSTSSAASSMDYVEWVQAQSTKETWADQVKNGDTQNFSLSYAPLEPAPVESTGEHVHLFMCSPNTVFLSMSLPTGAWSCVKQ